MSSAASQRIEKINVLMVGLAIGAHLSATGPSNALELGTPPHCTALSAAGSAFFAKGSGMSRSAKYKKDTKFFKSFYVSSVDPVPSLLLKLEELGRPLLKEDQTIALERGGPETAGVCDLYRKISDHLNCPNFVCGQDRIVLNIPGLVY
jgi:hypothetical protein